MMHSVFHALHAKLYPNQKLLLLQKKKKHQMKPIESKNEYPRPIMKHIVQLLCSSLNDNNQFDIKCSNFDRNIAARFNVQ